MKKIYIATLALSIIFSCSTDSTDDLIDTTNLNNPTGLVTYNEDIAPIINNNCLPCHSNPPQPGVPISLTTSDEVRIATVVTGGNGVIDRISLQPGQGGFMPQGGSRLPQNLIDLIIEWRDGGFLEGDEE